MDTAPTPVDAWRIAAQCTDVVLRFTAAFDDGDLARMQRHFAPDGVWQRHDGAVQGHDGLAALMAGRPAGIFVRHVLSNLRTELLSPAQAVVDAYVTVYRHDFPGAKALPAPLPGPDTVARYRDTLQLQDGAWRIARRQVSIDFKHP